MLRESFRLYNARRNARKSETRMDTTEAAFLESYAVHARNLIEFFAPRERDRELNRGIQARHYTDSQSSYGVPRNGNWLKSLDARLSHLSRDRLDHQNKPGWQEPVLIYETLEGGWSNFLDALLAERKEWFSVDAERVDTQSIRPREPRDSTSTVEVRKTDYFGPGG